MKTNIQLFNQKTISSREIAVLTGKQHAHVMDAIRTMEPAWEKVGQSKFRLTSYTDQWNRHQPMYELTKTESLYIATKFNDEARAKLIIRWEELEQKEQRLSVPDFSDAIQAARAWADAKEKEQKALVLLEDKTRQLDESKEWYTIKRYAKLNNLNWRKINWRALKAIACEHGYEIRKIFDANYGQVNIYHRDVFEIYFSN